MRAEPIADRPGRPVRPRSVSRRSKRPGPFFKFPLMDFKDAGYRNIAQCLGLSHRQLFDRCLSAFRDEAKQILGFGVVEASNLTPGQIRKIAARFQLADRAAFGRGGNQECN